MRYAAPNYAIAAPVAVKTSTAKIAIIVGVSITIVIVVGLGIVAIALGVGLGVGLRNSNSGSSRLSAPTVSCNPSTATCGCPSISPTFSARITGGTVATAGSWPWIVALFTNDTGFFCGGTLITYQNVLTAAHCVSGMDITKIRVYAGIQQLSSIASGQMRTVNLTTINSGYSSATFINDIAVLTLASPYTASATIGLCCLPTSIAVPVVNEHAVLAGWGQTSPTSSVSNNLEQTVTQVVSPTRCTGPSIIDSNAQVCAGFGTTDACFGDSGGPLMTSENNLWTCTGIVSTGSPNCNTYGVYTRVSNYQAFIQGVISG